MNEKEKKNKNADETLRIIKKILDYNKNAQRSFSAVSYADKGKSEPKDDKRKAEPKDGKRKSEVDKEKSEPIPEKKHCRENKIK